MPGMPWKGDRTGRQARAGGDGQIETIPGYIYRKIGRHMGRPAGFCIESEPIRKTGRCK